MPVVTLDAHEAAIIEQAMMSAQKQAQGQRAIPPGAGMAHALAPAKQVPAKQALLTPPAAAAGPPLTVNFLCLPSGNTRHYLRQLEELNDVWSQPHNPLSLYASGRRPPKPGEVLVDIKVDVSKMYSNFSRAFVIETIDTFLFSRVLSHVPNTIEHKRARRVRDIIMPLMIFLLEHIIFYITHPPTPHPCAARV